MDDQMSHNNGVESNNVLSVFIALRIRDRDPYKEKLGFGYCSSIY